MSDTVNEYFQFDDGTVLVRRTFTSTKAAFRMMSTGTNGQWVDDHALGFRCFGSDASRVTVGEAAKIAGKVARIIARRRWLSFGRKGRTMSGLRSKTGYERQLALRTTF